MSSTDLEPEQRKESSSTGNLANKIPWRCLKSLIKTFLISTGMISNALKESLILYWILKSTSAPPATRIFSTVTLNSTWSEISLSSFNISPRLSSISVDKSAISSAVLIFSVRLTFFMVKLAFISCTPTELPVWLSCWHLMSSCWSSSQEEPTLYCQEPALM